MFGDTQIKKYASLYNNEVLCCLLFSGNDISCHIICDTVALSASLPTFDNSVKGDNNEYLRYIPQRGDSVTIMRCLLRNVIMDNSIQKSLF
jgi:hypothetical protein